MLKQTLQKYGVHLDGHRYLELTDSVRNSLNAPMGMDAQPVLSTSPNSAIMSVLTTYIDPKSIEILFAPLKAVAVTGSEVRKGTWLDATLVFTTKEYTGIISSYDDYSEDGLSKANLNFPQRQPYTYQTMALWGIKEAERNSLTRVDWVNEIQQSAIWSLNQFQNNSYFFGVGGLQNYGILNDPSLPAAIPPLVEAGFGTLWSVKDALGIYDDIIALATQLIEVQSNGNVDNDTEMTLAMSPYANTQMLKVTPFNVSVMDMIKKNFPNLKIVVAPQFNTLAGEVVRLKANNLFGQITEECSFTDKLRTFPLITHSSSFSQKQAQGTNGTIIYRPILVATMLGV